MEKDKRTMCEIAVEVEKLVKPLGLKVMDAREVSKLGASNEYRIIIALENEKTPATNSGAGVCLL
jgi:hypothetical protein